MKKLMLFLLLLIGYNIAGPTDVPTLYIQEVRSIVKPPEKIDIQLRLFIEHLGLIESRNQWKVINSIGMMGKYQFSAETLKGLGYEGITPEKFRQDPSIFSERIQEEALLDLMKYNEKRLQKFTQYIGQIIDGVMITKAGLLAASHLAGAGNVQKYLTTTFNATDANGASVQKYLKDFQEYSI